MDRDVADASAPVIGLCVSEGGLDVIRDVLSTATGECGMAFVVVQHPDPSRDSHPAEILGRHTSLPVGEVAGGERPEANHVYVAPPGRALGIEDGRLVLSEFAEPPGLRRPIDDFLVSLARDRGGDAACVILSGTGADGSRGLRAIREHGGLAVAQDPETARDDGMPVAAIGTGLVDVVRPPRGIVDCLRAFFDRGGARVAAAQVAEICDILRRTTGHDFDGYEASAVTRRIERRMRVLGVSAPGDYLARLRDDAGECAALFRDLLIDVTRFFRDPAMFAALDAQVIRPLVSRRAPGGEIRVWVPGCSSGEEAYSVAILFARAVEDMHPRPAVRIFATDIDDGRLATAREGRYPAAALASVPEDMHGHCTIAREGTFRIPDRVRDMVRFSSHSVLRDPPFSELDLISCRNLLVHMGEGLQRQAFPLFHDALRDGGYLFLGPSESAGRHGDLFEPVDTQARLFRRRASRPGDPVALGPGARAPSRHGTGPREGMETSLPVRRLVERYAPASVVVDAEGQMLKSFGRLAKYFEYPDPGRDVIFAPSLARPGLREALPHLLRQCLRTRERVVVTDIDVRAEFGVQKIDVIADPLPDRTVLVVIRDAAPFEPGEDDDLLDMGSADSEMQVLRDELDLTRRRLRGAMEELRMVNEEFRSSKEGMMSRNTSLRSANEELTTVNAELGARIDELTAANSVLAQVFESTRLAVVALDRELRVRSFTEAAQSIFPLEEADRGRHLSEVACTLSLQRHMDDARAVLAGERVPARTVPSADGARHYSLRVLPTRARDGGVDGVTIVLDDLTETLQMRRDLGVARERVELAVRVAGIGVWEYQVDTGRMALDEGERAILGLSAEGGGEVGELIEMVVPEDRDRVEAALGRAIDGARDFDERFRIVRPDGEVRHLRGMGRVDTSSEPAAMIGVTFDVTAEARLSEQRDHMLSEMNHRVQNLFAVIASFVTGAARGATTVQGLAEQVRSRIEALGRSHFLTQDHPDGAVTIQSLVESVLDPYTGNATVRVAGPEAVIDHDRITPLAMILFEWATNSAKYGAFRQPGASVDVTWELSSGGRVALAWCESRKTTNPRTAGGGGYGTRLVKYSCLQLDATLDVDMDEDRWCSTLDFPIRTTS